MKTTTTTKSCSTTTKMSCRSSTTRTKTRRRTRKTTRTTTATAFAASSWGAPRQQPLVSARGSGRGTSSAARRGRRPCSAAASGRSRARPAVISGRSAAARPSCARFRRRRRRTRRRRPNRPCSWARSGRPACCAGSGPCRSASFFRDCSSASCTAVWAESDTPCLQLVGYSSDCFRRSREGFFAVSCMQTWRVRRGRSGVVCLD